MTFAGDRRITPAMPLPTITNAFRIAINYTNTLNLLTATNVIHVLGVSLDEENVFGRVNDAVDANMWSATTQALLADNVVVTKLDGTPDGVVFSGSDLSGDWPDGSGSQQFAPQVACLVKLNSFATGRSGRGRVYLPFVAEGAMQDGKILSANVTAAQTAWDSFKAALFDEGVCALGVASYVNESIAPVRLVTVEDFTATQRKRNKRR